MPRNKNKFKPAVDPVVEAEAAARPEDASTGPAASIPTATFRPRSKTKRKELALAKLQERQQEEHIRADGKGVADTLQLTCSDCMFAVRLASSQAWPYTPTCCAIAAAD